MKTKVLILIPLTLMIVNSMKAQTTPKVEVKELQDMHVLYYEYKGAYDQSFNDFPKLMGFIQSQNLPMGPYSIGLFYDDPQTVPVEDLRSEIGFVMAKKVSPEGIYKYKNIKACKAVTARYRSMEEIMAAYGALAKYIAENNIKTAPYSIELYYGNDATTIDAEIFMPIVE